MITAGMLCLAAVGGPRTLSGVAKVGVMGLRVDTGEEVEEDRLGTGEGTAMGLVVGMSLRTGVMGEAAK